MHLQKIVDYKRQELEHCGRKVSLKDVRSKAEDAEPPRNFIGALREPGVRIIAELKKASPSAGVICLDFDPIKIGTIYEDNGAACLSVVTDEHFFQGSLKHLEAARTRVALPCLRKDFTLDEYHIYEARAHGADAVLLIVRILEDAQIKDYAALAGDLGMSTLVEVHDEAELDRATKIGAGLVGINNRNLDTLQVDLETSVRLAPLAPRKTLLVAESGLSKQEDVQRLVTCGFKAFLIGETLMKAKNPGRALCDLLRD